MISWGRVAFDLFACQLVDNPARHRLDDIRLLDSRDEEPPDPEGYGSETNNEQWGVSSKHGGLVMEVMGSPRSSFGGFSSSETDGDADGWHGEELVNGRPKGARELLWEAEMDLLAHRHSRAIAKLKRAANEYGSSSACLTLGNLFSQGLKSPQGASRSRLPRKSSPDRLSPKRQQPSLSPTPIKYDVPVDGVQAAKWYMEGLRLECSKPAWPEDQLVANNGASVVDQSKSATRPSKRSATTSSSKFASAWLNDGGKNQFPPSVGSSPHRNSGGWGELDVDVADNDEEQMGKSASRDTFFDISRVAELSIGLTTQYRLGRVTRRSSRPSLHSRASHTSIKGKEKERIVASTVSVQRDIIMDGATQPLDESERWEREGQEAEETDDIWMVGEMLASRLVVHPLITGIDNSSTTVGSEDRIDLPEFAQIAIAERNQRRRDLTEKIGISGGAISTSMAATIPQQVLTPQDHSFDELSAEIQDRLMTTIHLYYILGMTEHPIPQNSTSSVLIPLSSPPLSDLESGALKKEARFWWHRLLTLVDAFGGKTGAKAGEDLVAKTRKRLALLDKFRQAPPPNTPSFSRSPSQFSADSPSLTSSVGKDPLASVRKKRSRLAMRRTKSSNSRTGIQIKDSAPDKAKGPPPPSAVSLHFQIKSGLGVVGFDSATATSTPISTSPSNSSNPPSISTEPTSRSISPPVDSDLMMFTPSLESFDEMMSVSHETSSEVAERHSKSASFPAIKNQFRQQLQDSNDRRDSSIHLGPRNLSTLDTTAVRGDSSSQRSLASSARSVSQHWRTNSLTAFPSTSYSNASASSPTVSPSASSLNLPSSTTSHATELGPSPEAEGSQAPTRRRVSSLTSLRHPFIRGRSISTTSSSSGSRSSPTSLADATNSLQQVLRRDSASQLCQQAVSRRSTEEENDPERPLTPSKASDAGILGEPPEHRVPPPLQTRASQKQNRRLMSRAEGEDPLTTSPRPHKQSPQVLLPNSDEGAQGGSTLSTLQRVENSSALNVRMICPACHKIGHNYPSCSKCGQTFCSRRCRVNSPFGDGQKHLCSEN